MICNGVGAVGGGGVETGSGTVKPNCIAAVCAGELESDTVIVNEKNPFEVGAPEITPVVEDRLSPEGNCPAVTVQLYAGVPPLAANATLNAVPRVGWGRDVVKSDSGETEAPFAGEVITTGTEVEEAFVAVF